MSQSISPTTFDDIVFRDPNIIPDDIAVGDITNSSGEAFTITIEKNLSEVVHNAGNRAYIDIELDERMCEILSALDATSVTTVTERSQEWFGEGIPRDVVEQFYRSCISHRKGRDGKFLRAKIPVQKQTAIVRIVKECNDDAYDMLSEAEDEHGEVDSLDEFAGQRVKFVVQLRTIRFLKQMFCLEFACQCVRMPHVQAQVSGQPSVNFAKMIIKTHETAEKRRLYQEKHAELLNVEKLKNEVEAEMNVVLERQQAITQNYMALLKEEESLREGSDWTPDAPTTVVEDVAATVVQDGQTGEPDQMGGGDVVETGEMAQEAVAAAPAMGDIITDIADDGEEAIVLTA